MIIINDKMFNIIRKESYNNSKYLPKGLNRILRDGVTLHNDCLVLDYFGKQIHIYWNWSSKTKLNMNVL